MLYKAGATTRLGSVEDGTSVADYDADAKEKKHTIDSSILHCNWKGVKSISSIRPDTSILFETLSPLLLLQKQPSSQSPLQTVFKSTPENYGILPVKRDRENNCCYQD